MSFIIWLSADIVQLGYNGRTAPYAGLRRAESYLLPEGKCVRHVHICQPTFLSPQVLSSLHHPHRYILTWGEEPLCCSLRDPQCIRQINYNIQSTNILHILSEWMRVVWRRCLGTHCHVHTTPTPEREAEPNSGCQSSTAAATPRRSGIPGESCPLTFPFISKAVARLVQRPLCDAVRLVRLFWANAMWLIKKLYIFKILIG